METLKKFIKKVQSDDQLQKEFVTLVNTDMETLYTYMRENGVSEEDLQAFKQQEHQFRITGELSDEELESVAGGGSFFSITCNGFYLVTKDW